MKLQKKKLDNKFILCPKCKKESQYYWSLNTVMESQIFEVGLCLYCKSILFLKNNNPNQESKLNYK